MKIENPGVGRPLLGLAKIVADRYLQRLKRRERGGGEEDIHDENIQNTPKYIYKKLA